MSFGNMTIDSGMPLTIGEDSPQLAPQRRAVLDSYRRGTVVDVAQSHFNRRPPDARRETATFSQGENLLAPHLGKEHTLLAWASEKGDDTDLPNAISNWLGLAPEERWWLYIMVKSPGTTPEPVEHPRGWRRAVRIAFSESPAPAPVDARHATKRTKKRSVESDDEQPATRKRLVSTRSLFDEASPVKEPKSWPQSP
jgi:hypothetical protein